MKTVLVLGIVVLLVIGSAVAASSQTPEWIVYNTGNSGLPSNYVFCLAFDAPGNLWIGTGQFFAYGGRGLAKFDGESWTVYDTANSGLPSDYVNSLAIGEQGNIWIGTAGRGLAVYREGGVILTGVQE